MAERVQNVWQALLGGAAQGLGYAGQTLIPYQQSVKEEERLERQLGFRERELNMAEQQFKLDQGLRQIKLNEAQAVTGLQTELATKEAQIGINEANINLAKSDLMGHILAMHGVQGLYDYERQIASQEAAAATEREIKKQEALVRGSMELLRGIKAPSDVTLDLAGGVKLERPKIGTVRPMTEMDRWMMEKLGPDRFLQYKMASTTAGEGGETLAYRKIRDEIKDLRGLWERIDDQLAERDLTGRAPAIKDQSERQQLTDKKTELESRIEALKATLPEIDTGPIADSPDQVYLQLQQALEDGEITAEELEVLKAVTDSIFGGQGVPTP